MQRSSSASNRAFSVRFYFSVMTSPRQMNSDDSHSDLSSKLVECSDKLRSMIDIGHGLLHELLSLNVLSRDQIEVIRSRTSATDRVSQLLDYVIKSPYVQQECFLVALNKTGQQHVNNYIIACGQPSETDIENWPLIASCEMKLLDTHWAKLLSLMDPKNGLLDEMFSMRCISKQQKESIEAGETTDSKNERLMDVVLKRSVGDYRKFIKCLLKTNQHQVASLLEPNISGSSCPLNDEQISRLTRHHATLVELLDVKDSDLLSRLYSAECLTKRQKELVECAVTWTESKSLLLDFVRKGSQLHFGKFVTCLRDSGQQHLCPLLEEDGVVAQIVTKLNVTRTLLYSRLAIEMNENVKYDVKEDEDLIVNKFKTLLRNAPRKRRKQLCHEIIRLNKELSFIDMNTRHSIALFFFCRTYAGFLYLNDLHKSGQLVNLLSTTFTKLMDCGRPVVIKSVMWERSNHAKCFEFFNATTNLSDVNEVLAFDLTSLDILPLELIELLMIKFTVALYQIMLPFSPQAEVCAVTTICAVSSLWRHLLIRQEYRKHLLKKHFRRVSHPFRTSSRLLQVLQMENWVWGVCEFDDKLYVASSNSSVIRVFNSSTPFNELAHVEVRGLFDPTDIVVCSDSSQLYVADRDNCIIWRVNLLSYEQVGKFIQTECRPRTLSTKSRRLLITSADGDALFIYGDDGVLQRRIELPDYMEATHAVETTHNTYIVSHYIQLSTDKQAEHDSLSEIGFDGRVVRTFNIQDTGKGSVQFKEPFYLALAGNSHVIVADRLNERIVVLNENLQLKRVLINSSHGQPWRLCYSQQNGLLFVANKLSVCIYRV